MADVGSSGQVCAPPSPADQFRPGRARGAGATSQAQSLGLRTLNSGGEIVNDSSLATNSLSQKRCLGKRSRIPSVQPDTHSGCMKQRLLLDFLSKVERTRCECLGRPESTGKGWRPEGPEGESQEGKSRSPWQTGLCSWVSQADTLQNSARYPASECGRKEGCVLSKEGKYRIKGR